MWEYVFFLYYKVLTWHHSYVGRINDRLEKWSHENLKKFNTAKYNVLNLGQDDPKYEYRMGNEWVERSPVGKDLGLLVAEKLDMSWYYVLVA